MLFVKLSDVWSKAVEEPFGAEEDMQNLLMRFLSSFLLSVGYGSAIAFREVPVAGKMIDILAPTTEGEVVLIECKTGSGGVREAVGQLLEYASLLWKLSYDELNGLLKKAGASSLDREVEDVAKALEGFGGVDAEHLRNSFEEKLQKGDFMLLVAVDKLAEEQKSIVDYLHQASGGRIRLGLLHVQRYALSDSSFKAAELTLYTPQLQRPRVWDDQSFIEFVRQASCGALDKESCQRVKIF